MPYNVAQKLCFVDVVMYYLTFLDFRLTLEPLKLESLSSSRRHILYATVRAEGHRFFLMHDVLHKI